MTTQKAFKWNEENTITVVNAYLAKLHEAGAVQANNAVFLTELAESVGAVSARSVRQKLASQKVYEKAEESAKAEKAPVTRQKKVILASLICDAIVANDDSLGDAAADIFASLEHAGRPALLALLAFVSGRPMGNEDLEG